MKVIDNQDNVAKCVCGNCPSYNDCMKEKGETLFCARGRAVCEFDKNGCICMQCPVSSENELVGGYYCA